MATPPTFVSENETAFNTATSPKTTSSFSVQTGDVLVGLGTAESTNAAAYDAQFSGGSLTWLEQREVQAVTDYCYLLAATTTATSTTSMTSSFSRTAGDASNYLGQNTLVFRNAGGIGATNVTNVSAGAPSLTLTTTEDNSAIAVIVSDWDANDGAARTWRTVNGVTPTAGNGYELTYFRDAVHFTSYIAYYPDAGTAGAKIVGLNAPSGIPLAKYSVIAIEIKPSTGGTDTPLTVTNASLSVTGQDVTLLLGDSQAITVTNATLSLAGQDVSLAAGSSLTIPVTAAQLSMSGQDVAFLLESPWVEGGLTLTGQNITLTAQASLSLGVTEATLTLTGATDITLLADFDYTVTVTNGALTLAGQDVSFAIASGNILLDVSPGTVLTLTGSDIGVNASVTISGSGSGARRKRHRGLRRLLNTGR